MHELAAREHRPHAFERGVHLGGPAETSVELAVPVGIVGRGRAHRAPVLGAQVLDDRAHDVRTPFVVGTAARAGALHDAGRLRPSEVERPAVDDDDEILREWVLPITDRARDDLRHPDVALDPRRLGLVLRPDAVLRLEPRGRGELDLFLAERREDLVDVAQEDGVGAHEEHPLRSEALPVRVEEVGRAVERDGRLARPGAALDDEHAGQLGPDRLVLLDLDRGDDVGHAPGAGPVDRREQRALAHDREPGRARGLRVEHLVVETDQVAPVARPRVEVAAPHHAERGDGRRPVERLGDGRPPVDDERRLLLVEDGDAPDVEAGVAVVTPHVEAPEAERGVADVEGGQPAPGQRVGGVPLEPGLVGPALTDLGIARGNPLGGPAHGVEARRTRRRDTAARRRVRDAGRAMQTFLVPKGDRSV